MKSQANLHEKIKKLWMNRQNVSILLFYSIGADLNKVKILKNKKNITEPRWWNRYIFCLQGKNTFYWQPWGTFSWCNHHWPPEPTNNRARRSWEKKSRSHRRRSQGLMDTVTSRDANLFINCMFLDSWLLSPSNRLLDIQRSMSCWFLLFWD